MGKQVKQASCKVSVWANVRNLWNILSGEVNVGFHRSECILNGGCKVFKGDVIHSW